MFKQKPLVDKFKYSHDLSAWQCTDLTCTRRRSDIYKWLLEVKELRKLQPVKYHLKYDIVYKTEMSRLILAYNLIF